MKHQDKHCLRINGTGNLHCLHNVHRLRTQDRCLHNLRLFRLSPIDYCHTESPNTRFFRLVHPPNKDLINNPNQQHIVRPIDMHHITLRRNLR